MVKKWVFGVHTGLMYIPFYAEVIRIIMVFHCIKYCHDHWFFICATEKIWTLVCFHIFRLKNPLSCKYILYIIYSCNMGLTLHAKSHKFTFINISFSKYHLTVCHLLTLYTPIFAQTCVNRKLFIFLFYTLCPCCKELLNMYIYL